MTQTKLDPTLYILTLLKQNDGVYNFIRLDGRQFKNETERFAIIDTLVDNGSISKVQGGIGQTYRLTNEGAKYLYQLCFQKVLRHIADHDNGFKQVSDILKELSIPDSGDELADAIELKLRHDDLVFSTEESGVMINDNGRLLLSHSSFSNLDQHRPMTIPNQQQTQPNNNILSDKKGNIFNWSINHIVQIIIGIIGTVIAGYILFRLGWI